MATPIALRVVEAEARTYRRTWRGSVFTSFLNPILYLLAMGVGLGTLVDANLPADLEGIDYLTFLAPGLLVATAMGRSIASVSEPAVKLMNRPHALGTKPSSDELENSPT